MKHFKELDIIKDSQHGFTSGRSCFTKLLEFFTEVYERRIGEGKPVDIIYLDFEKAVNKYLM